MAQQDLDDADIDTLLEQGVANEWRNVCELTRLWIPANSAVSCTARFNWLAEIGSVQLRPGDSQPWGNIAPRRLPSGHR